MADTQAQYRQPYGQQQSPTDAAKSMFPKGGPSAAQIVKIISVTFFSLLLGLHLWVLTLLPVFILFSPVLVPAALTVGLSVTGFLTSGAFGLTGMSSLAWILNYLRQVVGKVTQQFGENIQQMPDYLEGAKRQIQEGAGQLGHSTKEMGQQFQSSGKEPKETQRSTA
ncbi:Oleosin 18.2 kDa-like [Ranunculus cassubicifolius]